MYLPNLIKMLNRLDAASQKALLCEIVERVVLDPCGKVIRVELLPPFSYLHQMSDRIGGGQSSDNESGKTKTSISAGSCSTKLSLGGPNESLIDPEPLPIATIEFLLAISFPQQQVIARLSTGRG